MWPSVGHALPCYEGCARRQHARGSRQKQPDMESIEENDQYISFSTALCVFLSLSFDAFGIFFFPLSLSLSLDGPPISHFFVSLCIYGRSSCIFLFVCYFFFSTFLHVAIHLEWWWVMYMASSAAYDERSSVK